MQVPVTIAFDGVPESDAVQRAILEHARALERYYDRITSCRVVVARPQHRHRQGDLYTVRIDLTVPGDEVVVNRERRFDHAHEDVYVAIRDAFHAARRGLEDAVRRMRGAVKHHEPSVTGRVARVFPEEGYGFITTDDGREVYFHRNAVVGGRFERVRVGDAVRLEVEAGERGPQASTVRVLHPHRRRRTGPGAVGGVGGAA
jgi:cold shock CspA family protein